MTAEPLAWPVPRLLTVAEYLALGETEPGYTELMEGRVIHSPSPIPIPKHNIAGFELAVQLRPQLPPHLEVILDIDIDLELVHRNAPGFCRRPDLIVVRREELERVSREGGAIRAIEVLVVMETLSPSSQRTDNVIKRGEYADAGIPHYWILDLTAPVSLLHLHQAGELGYADGGTATGRSRVTEPFAAELDLDALG